MLVSNQSGRTVTIIGDEDNIRYFIFDDMPHIMCHFKLDKPHSRWNWDSFVKEI